MNKFQVKSIEDMIYAYPKLGDHYSFKDGDIQIIVITMEHYDYNFQPLLELKFHDVDRSNRVDGSVLVGLSHAEKIIKKLPEIKAASLVFVCCDAGLSRSPAIAKALAHYLQDIASFTYLSYQYPYANHDVFETILLGLRGDKMTTKRERMKSLNSMHDVDWKVEKNHKHFKDMK